MREEKTERRGSGRTYGGREIEIVIGGSVADDDFDRINGDNAPRSPGSESVRSKSGNRFDFMADTGASYTSQLLREAEQSAGKVGADARGESRRRTKAGAKADRMVSIPGDEPETKTPAAAEIPHTAAGSSAAGAQTAVLSRTESQTVSDAAAGAEPSAFAVSASAAGVKAGGASAGDEANTAAEIKAEKNPAAAKWFTRPAAPAAAVQNDAAPQTAAEAEIKTAPAADNAPQNSIEKKKNRKGIKTVIIAAASVLAVCLAAVCGLLVMLSAEEQEPVLQISHTDIVVVSLSDATPGYSLSSFNCNFSFPAKNTDETVMKIADGLMGDQLYVHHIMEPETYDISKINWDIQAKDSPNSYQLYLQSLTPMVYLLKAYELTGDTAYIQRAEQFIWSWDAYQRAEGNSRRNTFLWNDHGAALRAENLIYFYFTADKGGCLTEKTGQYIINILARHAEFLYDDANYTENHNHGIFQDRALLYVAYFLNDGNFERWTSKAVSRLEQQRAYAFTEEMVHVENSPNYQVDVTNTLRVIAEFLMQFESPYGQQLHESLSRSAEFMTYIIKPNGYAAEIGDTDGSADIHSTAIRTDWAEFGNEHLSYAATQGLAGEQPQSNAAFFPESGYYIYRADWNRKNFSQSTWSMFKSGYSSATHKHCDDNSFMLYTHGYDVFADTGYYNYMTGSEYSDYLTSAGGHNTVIVDGRSYSTTAENSHLTGIYDCFDGENYDYALGVNEVYSGVSFDRHFYNLGEAIIIYDDLRSQESHTYSQLFHLGETAEIVESGNANVLIKLGDTGAFVRIRQLGVPCELSVINGAESGAGYGFISRQLNHIDTIDTLKFDLTGDSVSFITLITIENHRGRIDGIRRIDFENGVFTVKKSLFSQPYTITLQHRDRVDAADAVVSQTDADTFVFTDNNRAGGRETAWEIIRKSDASVVSRQDYQNSAVFEYEFAQPGEYLVRMFVRDGRLERSAVVAAVRYDAASGQWKNVTDQYPHLNLSYLGHAFTQNENGEYTFEVVFDYSWDYTIRWYIYKNGAYYDTKTTTSSRLDYNFTQSGTYTVMYYLRTAGGDNEYWNYPEINIEAIG